ncbi:MAG: MFS transporter [Rikenellaceae bacterium]
MNSLNEKVWSKDFILIFISNFLVFFCYYMLLPILPRYIMASFQGGESMVGIIVGCFTIASLSIRPISGFIVDKFSRKPLYFICYALFAAAMGGYILASSVVMFIILRIVHGYGFGLNTVGGLTYAIDVLPNSRRGEGIGYFGVAYSVAMAVGPLAGNMLYKAGVSFENIFIISFVLGCLGLVSILPIKPIKIEKKPEEKAKKDKITFGRFILLKGLPCVAIIALTGYGYGAVSTFVTQYTEQSAFGADVGYFFFILASGIVAARIFSAKMINRGEVLKSTYIGGAFVLTSYLLFLICNNSYVFYLLAALFGIGFGYFGSSFQAMLVNLAEPTQRGTASATYYTFWDMGIGIGTVTGGMVLEASSFQTLFILCISLVAIALIYFRVVSDRYYKSNKLV